MKPVIQIGTFTCPSYVLMAILGLACALGFACFAGTRFGIRRRDIFGAGCYGLLGLLLLSKLFYGIPFLPEIAEILRTKGLGYFGEHPEYVKRIFAGSVFYGGFLGLLTGVALYGRLMRANIWNYLDMAAAVTPLFHMFGRIGCFLAGCCYGKIYHGFGHVKYHVNMFHPGISGTERYPVQLWESVANFCIFCVLLWLIFGKKRQYAGEVLQTYLLLYPLVRILTECFRGDAVRGVWELFGVPVSFGQLVSAGLLIWGIWIYRDNRKL